MSDTAPAETPTDFPKGRPLTIWMDGDLAKLGRKYARLNRNEKSLSRILERLLARHLAGKVGKYGLRLPPHFVS